MDKRPYNIFFDLHTVSGIVISVLLYVIFFAGSFSFFKDEIINWERNEKVSVKKGINLNVDVALDSIQKKYPLYGREISLTRAEGEQRIMVNVSNSKDTLIKEAGAFFYLNTDTYKSYDYESSYSLGEFLYRLHFFAQIPYPAGYYLSGFTALFLFFVLLTGILIHWKKIISNFFVFRPWTKLKTVWTDAHTALGTIGLPFQAVYAITGAFFMIKIFLMIPNVMALYNGDQNKLYSDLGYQDPSYAFENKKINKDISINEFIKKTDSKWNNFDVTNVSLYNYGDKNMHISVAGELGNSIKFTGVGEVTYQASTKKITNLKDPYKETTYLDEVKNTLFRLHFGDYGGYALKIASFLMGVLSCFVIVTGILVWFKARNKKNIPEKEKRYNEMVGHIYLAICLTMLPVTALSFIVTKLLPHHYDSERQTILYSVFFISWLLLSIFFIVKKNNHLTNKYTLLSGGILGMLIPVVNGIVTGNWIWHSIETQQYDIFVVDIFWIFISVATLYAAYRSKKSISSNDETIQNKKDTTITNHSLAI